MALENGGRYQLKGSMFQRPLDKAQSQPEVENIFVSSSPLPRLTLNWDLKSKWDSLLCSAQVAA